MKPPPVRCKCGRAWVAEWAEKCERCQQEEQRHQEKARPRPFTCELKTTERGYDAAWTQARSGLLARAPWCIACLCRDRIVCPAAVVDHIAPFHSAPEAEREAYRLGQWNLQGLCARHHDGMKRWMESKYHWSEVRTAWVKWLTQQVLTPEAKTLLSVLGLNVEELESRRIHDARSGAG